MPMPKRIFESSKNQPTKKTKIGDGDAKQDDLEGACHDFLKEAHEDILLEIFLCLPDSRSAIRTSIVCHNWHSLISHNPRFIPTFISHHHQHQHRYSLPYTVIFRKADKNLEFAGPQYFQPICKLFSEEPMLASTNFLDFLPSPMVIRGSCNDLLLVTSGSRWSTDFYICNPITKQFIQLPEMPRPKGFDWTTGHALVCMPGPTNEFRFKVVEFQHHNCLNPESELPQVTTQEIQVFCSESRKWEMRTFHYPQARLYYVINWLHAIPCNGILYWLEYELGEVDRVIYLDLSNNQCGVIDFPDDFCYDPQLVREQIGGVRVGGEEELRLLQVVHSTDLEWAFDLNVWKWGYNPDNQDKKEWVLVHHKKKLERPSKKNQGLPFVHPTNGDLVFIVWGQNVFQYNLRDATTTPEIIGKLQEPLKNQKTGTVATKDRLLPFPVMHQIWPTQILAWSRLSI